MMWNRRQHERNAIEGFSFLQIGQDEGGRVLNISEGGLRFESFAPVPENEPIHLWFSFTLRERIEATGEVAWADGARKTGGLKFLGLSEQAREQIRAWTKRPFEAENTNREDVPRSETGIEVTSRQIDEPDAAAAPVGREPLADAILVRGDGGDEKSDASGAAIRASFQAARLVPLERYHSDKRRQFILGILLGILVSVGAGIFGFQYGRSHRPSADLQSAPPPATTTNSDAQGDAREPPSASDAMPPSLNTSSERKSREEETSIRSSTRPPAPIAAADSVRSREILAPTSSTPAQPQPRKTTVFQKNAATPQQLWASVEAGSTRAAVTLADRYIRGDGVPANCDQARVLLRMASEKGSAEATRKLRELDSGGCPAR